ncbi:hypothetical protein YC2023_017331 [Brassica napus]
MMLKGMNTNLFIGENHRLIDGNYRVSIDEEKANGLHQNERRKRDTTFFTSGWNPKSRGYYPDENHPTLNNKTHRIEETPEWAGKQ